MDVRFGDTEIEKRKSHCHKKPILINVVDINKIIVSDKVSFHKKVLNILLITKIAKNRSHYA